MQFLVTVIWEGLASSSEYEGGIWIFGLSVCMSTYIYLLRTSCACHIKNPFCRSLSLYALVLLSFMITYSTNHLHLSDHSFRIIRFAWGVLSVVIQTTACASTTASYSSCFLLSLLPCHLSCLILSILPSLHH